MLTAITVQNGNARNIAELMQQGEHIEYIMESVLMECFPKINTSGSPRSPQQSLDHANGVTEGSARRCLSGVTNAAGTYAKRPHSVAYFDPRPRSCAAVILKLLNRSRFIRHVTVIGCDIM